MTLHFGSIQPAQAIVGRSWYQSSRNVAFVQHSDWWLAGAVQVALHKAVE
jgi:hypothetical protein